MNSAVKFCLEVLQGNILIDNQKIKVIKRHYPLDKTPCVTLDDSGGTTVISKDLINMNLKLPPNHPQYSIETKDQLFPQEVVRSKYLASVNINTWSDSENEREIIDEQVKLLFNKAFTDHYMFCTNFNKETNKCLSLDVVCPATVHFLGKSAKKQCPKPLEYGYENLFTKLDLDKYTFELAEPFSMDELNSNPRVLRSVHQLNISYYRNYVVGGNYLNNITVNFKES